MGRKLCVFSHSVFKRLVLYTRKNQGLFGKELKQIKCYRLSCLFERVENTEETEKQCRLQAFTPFPAMFSNSFDLTVFCDCVVKA